MVCCDRPVWTSCFLFVWILVVPGALLTHRSLDTLLPHLRVLPQNLAKGFDETFKFAYLQQDSLRVERAAEAALLKCRVAASVNCSNISSLGLSAQGTSNTSKEQASMASSFETSLSMVNTIANDKYFGIHDLKSTARSLNTIVDDMQKLNATMKCIVSAPVFCNIYTSAGHILAGMSSVHIAIDKFKTSDIVERWEDNHRFLILLHGAPYIIVAALLFFTCFWMRGGVCCCCKGGTTASLALIPYALLWLVSFAIYFAIFAMGVTLKYFPWRVNVPALKWSPNLEDVIKHIQLTHPEFWELVFANMVDGLDLLLKASAFFVFALLIVAVYSLSECCFCPYRKHAQEGKETS